MNDVARVLIYTGGFLMLVGFVLFLAGRFVPLGHLPGDIVIHKKNYSFYIPLASCLLISLLLSILLFLVQRRP